MRLGLYVKRLEVRQGRSGGARARRRRAARGSLRIALPPLELALRARYLAERRQDPAAAAVAAWAAVRNKAAHGRFTDYTDTEVRQMHQGVADFVATFLEGSKP